jgi:hypothetical protein
MSRWTVWEWIAYTGLFVAAIIIAADQGVKLSPPLFEKFSRIIRSLYWAFAPLTLILLSTAILCSIEFGWIGSSLEETAELQLRFYQGRPVPTAVLVRNIWRWYSLKNIAHIMTPQGAAEAEITNIFINFNKPVGGQLKQRFSGLNRA